MKFCTTFYRIGMTINKIILAIKKFIIIGIVSCLTVSRALSN